MSHAMTMCRMQALPSNDGVVSFGLSRIAGSCLLVIWAAVLIGALAIRAFTSYSDHYAQPLHWFETFYRVGSLIYGGGQVVLPMLLTECVQYDCFVDDHGKQVRVHMSCARPCHRSAAMYALLPLIATCACFSRSSSCMCRAALISCSTARSGQTAG